MLFKHIYAALAGISLTAAAAIPDLEKPVATRVLQHDDIVVLGPQGRSTIMKNWEYERIQRRNANRPRLSQPLKRTPSSSNPSNDRLVFRQNCDEQGQSTEVQVLSDTTVTTPDVAMSAVVTAAAALASVSLSSGYQIANTVTVGVEEGVTIESVFTASLSISYATTWTSSFTQAYTFVVPIGSYGLVVSEPSARQVSGNVFYGCYDNPSVASYVSLSYTSETYDDLNWVQGIIRLCNSTTYPVPYCSGTGTHY